MNLLSISQLALFSGIKPHTIRIWEQRYNALKPERSEGNTRYYNGDQLRRLLNIVSLIETKHKISALCTMSDDQLSALVMEQKNSLENKASEYFVSQLIASGMAYNEELFEELFEECIANYGLAVTYKTVIYPMLLRIGIMWSSNTIPSVQEHFITNIIRRKILKSIDLLPPASAHAHKWMLFLPEDEFHEIGLLFAAFMIRESGHKVLYLGNSVPAEEVIRAMQDINPKYLLSFLVRFNLIDEIQSYLNELNANFKGETIFIAGNHKLLSEIEFSKKIHWLQNIDTLENLLNTKSDNLLCQK